MRVYVLSLTRYSWSFFDCGLTKLILKDFLAVIKTIHFIYCAQFSKVMPCKPKKSNMVCHSFIKIIESNPNDEYITTVLSTESF